MEISHCHVTTAGFDAVFHDGQSQPHPTGFTSTRRLRAEEWIEQAV